MQYLQSSASSPQSYIQYLAFRFYLKRLRVMLIQLRDPMKGKVMKSLPEIRPRQQNEGKDVVVFQEC